MVEWLAGNRIKGTSTERTTGTTTYSTIAKDNQAIIQHGTAGYGAPTTFSSFVVGNNSNRALIVATGAYNASPSIVSVKFNGTESFTKIQNHADANYRVELWILLNPTVTTANVVIEWGTQSGYGGAGAGQMGAICYSFYNVKQSDAFGTPVTKTGTSSATPFIAITPTTEGSMIIDSWFNGAGSPTPNNDETDGMNIICGGVDRSMASQYDLSPTIGSANNMSRTSGNTNFVQTAVEIKAFATVTPSLMPTLQSPSVGGWKEIGRISAGGSSKFNTVSSLDDKRYYMVLGDLREAGGGSLYFRFGDSGDGTLDSGNRYATEYNQNGTEASPLVSQPEMFLGSPHTQSFSIGYIANKSGREKLSINHMVRSGGANQVSNYPQRADATGKWVNSTASNVIDTISHYNYSENWSSGSETVVLGWDPTDTHTDNFWEELCNDESTTSVASLESGTITAKKYLWIQCYISGTSASTFCETLFNNNTTGSKYSSRGNQDGGSDFMRASQNDLNMFESYSNTTGAFINAFIVNPSDAEKLGYSHSVREGTSGGDQVTHRDEVVFKWASNDQITDISFTPQSGTINADSYLKVWGSD